MNSEESTGEEAISEVSRGLVDYTSVTWSEAIKTEEKDTTSKVQLEQPIEDNFAFRCNKDKSVRRLRLRDVWTYLSADTRECMEWLTHLDQILVTNLSIWTEIHGKDKFMAMKENGIFNNIETFISETSRISNRIKRVTQVDPQVKQALAEMNGLTGYLQNDIEPVDWKDELSKLAHGGEKHGGEDWMEKFEQALDTIYVPSTQPEFISFEDYIKSNQWKTSGSSSIGHLEWHIGNKRGKFKARKNMLEALYSPEELIDLCRRWDGVLRSRGFIKDELSKRRLAVASNIEAYLFESYIMRIVGHGYKNWKYITLDETAQTQHERNSGVVEKLKDDMWALPFDFKGFDHQPTTQEIQAIISKTVSRARIPHAHQNDWEQITTTVISSYAKSRISLTLPSGQVVEEHVSGGLPSGVRWTSLLGNQWNAAVTQIARERTASVLGYDPVLTAGVKGDDTYIIAKRPLELYIFRLAYASINAIGVDSKFGISKGICEFLRNEISGTGMRGWSNRSIPSITQRKPWNPQPWGISAGVSILHSNIQTLERRVQFQLDFLHQASKNKWSKFTEQESKWLELPTRLGGFGLYRWKGEVPDKPFPRKEGREVRFSGIRPSPQLTWITLSEKELVEYSNISLNNMIASDDIQGMQSKIGRNELELIRTTKIVWRKEDVLWNTHWATGPQAPEISEKVYWPKQVERAERNEEFELTVTQFMREYAIASRITKLPTLRKMIERYYPRTYVLMRKYEQKGWHRTDAIRLATGDVPLDILQQIHPALAVFVKEYVLASGVKVWQGRRTIGQKLYETTRIACSSIYSSAANAMYWY